MKKETIAYKIETEMTIATRWMAVSDLVAVIGCSTSAIRRNLRKHEFTSPIFPGIYKSQKIPGDQHGRNQWALNSVDTTGWSNASPIRALPKPKKSKTATVRLSTVTSLKSTPPRSLGSYNYKGLILMCAPANKPTLIHAVGDLLVNEFVTSGKKFSAYDVTKRLRDLVLEEAKDHEAQMAKVPPGTQQTFALLLEPQEQGTVFVQGLKVCKVEHEDVKAIVHDIFNAGGMPNLSRRRDSTDQYWEYGPTASLLNVSITADATGATSDPDPISGGTMGSTYDGSSTI